MHKNDRQVELLEEISEVRIHGLVKSLEWADRPVSYYVTFAVSGSKPRS